MINDDIKPFSICFVVELTVDGVRFCRLLGAALLAQLDDTSLRGRLHQRFSEMHGTLARGCAKRSAEAILAVCESVKESA